VGGGEKFFRVGANSALEARMERIGGLFEDAAIGGESALAGFQIALPDSGSFALH